MNIRTGNIFQINIPLKTFMIIVFLLTSGCIFSTRNSGPGLMAAVTAKDILAKDVKILEKILLENGYELIYRKDAQNAINIKYLKIIFSGERFDEPSITVGITCKKAENDDLNKYMSIDIAVFNLRHGGNIEIRNDIIFITDLLYKELEKLKGKGNVFREEYKVGPPLL